MQFLISVRPFTSIKHFPVFVTFSGLYDADHFSTIHSEDILQYRYDIYPHYNFTCSITVSCCSVIDMIVLFISCSFL